VNQTAEQPLIGLAALAARAFRGDDLAPIAEQLTARIRMQPDDAAARMDLATIHFLSHEPELALQLQAEAIALQPRYRLACSPDEPEKRLLAIMGPGGLMDNLPLEFLLEGSAIAMDLHYMLPGALLPQDLDGYDLLFVAVGESDANRPLLQQLARQLRDCRAPVLNAPEHAMRTTREDAAEALQQVDGIEMPMSVRLDRVALASISGKSELERYLPGRDFPIIVRPVESHAGHGLKRLDQPTDIGAYLPEQQESLFYISPFINYASTDGQFRKYRVALIEGDPYLCHLAISSHWIVHYLNAGMLGDADKCAEEARCMAEFDHDFGARHANAFAAISHRMGLEYLIIDCAETHDGRLLVFEVDTSAIVHAMDPIEIFPYKQPQMHKIFHAFQAMLMRRA